MVVLRPAGDPDVPELVCLLDALGYATDAETLRGRLLVLAADPDHRTLVAEDAGRLVGLADFRRVDRLEAEPYVYLSALVVARGVQGRGIGRTLLEAVESWARSVGAVSVVLTSSHHRTGSHRFYEKVGYASSGVRFTRRLTSR